MASSPPSDIDGRIQFFQQRIAAWNADPAAIGLTAQQIADLQAKLTAAGNARAAALTARQQAKNATATQNSTIAQLMEQGTAMIAAIRAFASLSDDPDQVYDAADIDAPAAPGGTLPPPQAAADVRTSLENTGAVRVHWKGTTANGTVYSVWRRLDPTGEFVQIGTSTTRSFLDQTIPLGTPEANYFVIAHRDGLNSPASETVSIRFGFVNPDQGNALAA